MNTAKFLISHWHFDLPTMIIALVMLGLFFYWQKGRFIGRNIWYFAAIALFIIVNMSSLDFLGRKYLFSAHMVQHIIILLVVPPMMITGLDPEVFERYKKNPVSRKIGDALFHPLVGWIAGVGSMWLWHIPDLFDAMKHSQALMTVQVISLLVLGFIFIWPVFNTVNWRKLTPLQSALYLFTTCVGCTVLGIFITFSPADLYTSALSGNDPAVLHLVRDIWGITPDVDQEMGGLIMWVPACIVYLTYIMIVLFHYLGSSDKEAN